MAKVGEDAGKLELSYTAGGNAKCYSCSRKQLDLFFFLTKFSMHLPHPSAITSSRIYPRDMKTSQPEWISRVLY